MNETDLRNKIREAVRQALANSSDILPDGAKTAPAEYIAPWTGVSYEAHPSQQKLNIGEASSLLGSQIADQLGSLLELSSGQNCTIEKGKPCDQCGMCRSLGF